MGFFNLTLKISKDVRSSWRGLSGTLCLGSAWGAQSKPRMPCGCESTEGSNGTAPRLQGNVGVPKPRAEKLHIAHALNYMFLNCVLYLIFSVLRGRFFFNVCVKKNEVT